MKSVLNTIEVFGKANPDHPAIINIDGLITYKLLSDMIASAAIEIENMCLDKNKLVGILFLNSAYHLIFNMALAKAGLASVSLTIGTLPLAQKLNVQCIIADKGDFSTKIPIVTPTNEWFKRKQNKVFTSVETSSSRIVKVSFTSGSTGENKPIGFTERAIFYRLRDARLKVLSNEERMLCLFGIESNVGLMSALGCLQNGRTVCFVRTPEHALKMLQKLSITCVAGSVTHLSKLAEMCLRRGSRFASVRKVMSAGSFLSDDNLNKIHAVFPADVYDVYASTEAGTCGLNLRSIVANQKIWGRFAPCTGVEIMLGDHGDELGQIIVHSNSRCFPFEGDLIESRDSNEPFIPGDLGYLDADGWLVVTGRSDNLINFGGVKKTSDQIETTLQNCNLVSDAAVFRKDSKAGPRIILAYTAREGFSESSFKEWCNSNLRGLRFDVFLQLEDIPRNENGKIDRRRLLEMVR